MNLNVKRLLHTGDSDARRICSYCSLCSQCTRRMRKHAGEHRRCQCELAIARQVPIGSGQCRAAAGGFRHRGDVGD
jgi:hypothetical protein